MDSWQKRSEFYHFDFKKCIWSCRLPKWRPFHPGGDELMSQWYGSNATFHNALGPQRWTLFSEYWKGRFIRELQDFVPQVINRLHASYKFCGWKHCFNVNSLCHSGSAADHATSLHCIHLVIHTQYPIFSLSYLCLCVWYGFILIFCHVIYMDTRKAAG